MLSKLRLNSKVVILTGAGVSAESGLSTFRENNGLWESHKVEDVATPEAFSCNPDLVHKFYNLRRSQLSQVIPNKAHFFLSKVTHQMPNAWLVTQNVDDLHQRAGSKRLLQMHGSLLEKRCIACNAISDVNVDLSVESQCHSCGCSGVLRPNIVWFGEEPFHLRKIHFLLSQCDFFISIGTSGAVYPAAGFAGLAASNGAHTVELNLVPSDVSSVFAEKYYGAATEVVPEYFTDIVDFE